MTTSPSAQVVRLPVRQGHLARVAPVPVLDLVVPVFDEAVDLEPCVRRLVAHAATELPWPVRVTVADNASTDGTLEVARRLARELPSVEVLHLEAKGRGRALKAAWLASPAPVVAYTDVDLSTDLSALLPLVAPLVSGHSDVAIGSRLARGSRVVRGPKREVISRGYNLLLRGGLHLHASDAQCGFKALRREAAQVLLPLVQDTGWFFDTELLVLAERAGLRVHEVPVDWVDDPDSRVDIVPTAVADLLGMARLGRDLAAHRLPLDDVRRRVGRGRAPARTTRLETARVETTRLETTRPATPRPTTPLLATAAVGAPAPAVLAVVPAPKG